MANVPLAKEYLEEAAYLISATTVVAIFYTFVFMLYCLSLRLSYAQLRDDNGKINRRTACTFALQTALLICATLNIIVINRRVEVAFIDNRTLPGGPLGPSATHSVATLARLGEVVNTIEILLILGVLLWRVWVVWSGTRFVIPVTIVSSFFYLGNVVFGISFIVMTWSSDTTNNATTSRAVWISFIMATAFSFSSLVFMTSAIIARLLLVRREHIKLMGRCDVAGQYLGIATMLIESQALDAVWGTGSLIAFVFKHGPIINFFGNSIVQVKILTSFLVIYRVLSGRAWDRQTGDRLSTLRWGSNGADTTASGTVELRQTIVPERDSPVISFRGGV